MADIRSEHGDVPAALLRLFFHDRFIEAIKAANQLKLERHGMMRNVNLSVTSTPSASFYPEISNQNLCRVYVVILSALPLYELCFTGEKLRKTTTAPQANEAETEKSQNYHCYSMNGEKKEQITLGLMSSVGLAVRSPIHRKSCVLLGSSCDLNLLRVIEENLD
ncbi:hypothetical protein SLEP1_g38323 [Rubroshorea leprosula]|nr:hypothetical protein SLEP1_g38323 [Rubroshorea leprosula]